MPGDDNNVGQHLRLTTICLGLAATLPIYVGVAFYRVVVAAAEPALSGDTTLIPEGLALAGVALVFVAPLVKRAMRSPVVATLTTFLLRQTTGLLGLVITLLTGDLVWCAALCVVALLAMVVDWPRTT